MAWMQPYLHGCEVCPEDAMVDVACIKSFIRVLILGCRLRQ